MPRTDARPVHAAGCVLLKDAFCARGHQGMFYLLNASPFRSCSLCCCCDLGACTHVYDQGGSQVCPVYDSAHLCDARRETPLALTEGRGQQLVYVHLLWSRALAMVACACSGCVRLLQEMVACTHSCRRAQLPPCSALAARLWPTRGGSVASEWGSC